MAMCSRESLTHARTDGSKSARFARHDDNRARAQPWVGVAKRARVAVARTLGLACAMACGALFGCSSSTQGGDAATDVVDAASGDAQLRCEAQDASFPQLDRTCATAGECVVALHTTNCCGSQRALGIRASERSRFDSAESACEQTLPACGCFADDITTDDGMTTHATAALAVECRSGRCTTTLKASRACGTETCGATQVCVQGCCGTYGCTPPPSRCVELPSACSAGLTCGCFTTNPCVAGSCAEVTDGEVVCRCA